MPEKLLTAGFTRVKPKYGFVVELDTDGNIIGSLQDPTGQVISDVSQVGGYLKFWSSDLGG